MSSALSASGAPSWATVPEFFSPGIVIRPAAGRRPVISTRTPVNPPLPALPLASLTTKSIVFVPATNPRCTTNGGANAPKLPGLVMPVGRPLMMMFWPLLSLVHCPLM